MEAKPEQGARTTFPTQVLQSILKVVSPMTIHAKLVPNKIPVTDVTTEAGSIDIPTASDRGEASRAVSLSFQVLELGRKSVVLDKGGKSRGKCGEAFGLHTSKKILEKLKKQVRK